MKFIFKMVDLVVFVLSLKLFLLGGVWWPFGAVSLWLFTAPQARMEAFLREFVR